jgi:hypothetical protein
VLAGCVIYADWLVSFDLRAVDHSRAVAIRKAAARKKSSASSKLHDHVTAAHRTGELLRTHAEIRKFIDMFLLSNSFRKRRIKIPERFHVFTFSFRNLVEFVFHFARERVRDVVAEMRFEKRGNHIAGISRHKRAADFLHVAAIDNRFHYRCICRGTSDAALFEFLDKSCFCVP